MFIPAELIAFKIENPSPALSGPHICIAAISCSFWKPRDFAFLIVLDLPTDLKTQFPFQQKFLLASKT